MTKRRSRKQLFKEGYEGEMRYERDCTGKQVHGELQTKWQDRAQTQQLRWQGGLPVNRH